MYVNCMDLYNTLFKGDTKYTTGIIFTFGNIAAFFLNMRKLKIKDSVSLSILAIFIICARLIV